MAAVPSIGMTIHSAPKMLDRWRARNCIRNSVGATRTAETRSMTAPRKKRRGLASSWSHEKTREGMGGGALPTDCLISISRGVGFLQKRSVAPWRQFLTSASQKSRYRWSLASAGVKCVGNQVEVGTGPVIRPERPEPPRFTAIASVTRSMEWWEFKLLPAAAIYYATAFRTDLDWTGRLLPFIQLVGALAVGAAFVGVLNDWTDREEDQRAGKPNRLTGVSNVSAGLIVAALVGLGLAFLWSFRGNPATSAIYLVGWLAFSCYSLPFVRMKGRAAAGLVCDAIGAHWVPAMLAVMLASGHGTVEPAWAIIVTIWSLAYGARGILSHQLADEAFDRAADIRTFVVHFGLYRSQLLGRWVLFPVEVASLFAILAMLGSVVPTMALAVYAFALIARIERFQLRSIIVGPSARSVLVLNDFYEVYWPVSLLILVGARNPSIAILFQALVQLLLFPRLLIGTARDLIRLTKRDLA